MQVDYSYTLNNRDYYSVVWRGINKHVFIPTGLLDSVFKRHLLAVALLMVRRAHRDELLMLMAERLNKEQFKSDYPILFDLSNADVVDVYDQRSFIAISSFDGYRYYSKSEAKALLAELSKMIDGLEDDDEQGQQPQTYTD